MRDLTDRHGRPVARGDSHILEPVERGALARNGAGDDVDPLLSNPERGDGRPADQRLQRLSDVLRRQAQSPGARLVDLEAQRRHFLAPVEMRVDQPRIGAHDVAHARRGFAHDVRLRSDDAKLDRKSNRRAEIEPVEPDPRRAQRALGDGGFDTRLDPFARLDVARDDDDLGEKFIGLHRLEPEPEPGRALADV